MVKHLSHTFEPAQRQHVIGKNQEREIQWEQCSLAGRSQSYGQARGGFDCRTATSRVIILFCMTHILVICS